MARILIFDLECTNLRSDFGTALCVGYKWYGDRDIYCPAIYDYPNWRNDMTNDKRLLQDFYKVWCQADMVVGFNSKMFDQKWINGKLWQHGLPLLPPVPHVDLYFAAKTNLNMSRKSLANISAVGGFENHKEVTIGTNWVKASVGHLPSLKEVVKHCIADILVTEEAYERLRPYIRTHPNVATPDNVACRVCGSHNLQKRGSYLSATKVPKARFYCKDCGGWSVRDTKTLASRQSAWSLK